jgi:hypothetical protein
MMRERYLRPVEAAQPRNLLDDAVSVPSEHPKNDRQRVRDLLPDLLVPAVILPIRILDIENIDDVARAGIGHLLDRPRTGGVDQSGSFQQRERGPQLSGRDRENLVSVPSSHRQHDVRVLRDTSRDAPRNETVGLTAELL